MRELLGQSGWVARRHLWQLFRQPWLMAINLVQPFLWLLLFSVTFRGIADIPGFAGGNYPQFILPGLIVMTILLASGWNGLSVLGDTERGTLDRVLVSPVRRPALIVGPLLQQAVSGLLPTAIIVALGYPLGARFQGGAVDAVLLVVALAFASAALAGLSIAVALLVHREESLIAMVNFLVMPLTFLSTAFMPANLVPGWVRAAIRANPVNWTVDLCRAAFDGVSTWSFAGPRLAALGALAAGAGLCAGMAMRRYRAAA